MIGSCQPQQRSYTMIYSEEEPIGTISRTLAKALESNHNIKIELINGVGSQANVDSISLGKADFTITENYMSYQPGVNSLLVFYPQVLHVFYNAKEEPTSFTELVQGKTVFMGNPGSGSYQFMMNLLDFFAVDTSGVHITDDAFDEIDVFAGFSDILPNSYLIGLEQFKLFSFGDVSQYGKGSLAEAISVKFPKVHPYIIPEKTYAGIAEKPTLTIASNAILVSRADLPETEIYDLVSALFHEKQEFNDISPLIYRGMTEQFDRTTVTFPLHEGARLYLDRDEPGLYERYAEMIGVVFSIMIALVSGGISINRWQKHRKKDRVDVFYKELMDIKNALPTLNLLAGYEHLKRIKNSQNKAFSMLINEDLEANESFRIYMELSKETINEVKVKMNFLKKKGHAVEELA